MIDKTKAGWKISIRYCRTGVPGSYVKIAGTSYAFMQAKQSEILNSRMF
jgi:hypothetical protein